MKALGQTIKKVEFDILVHLQIRTSSDCSTDVPQFKVHVLLESSQSKTPQANNCGFTWIQCQCNNANMASMRRMKRGRYQRFYLLDEFLVNLVVNHVNAEKLEQFKKNLGLYQLKNSTSDHDAQKRQVSN